MKEYIVLNQQVYSKDQYSIVPIRYEDRYDIMKWRNEQMYHLRQRTSLTKDAQDQYFNSVVAELFKQDKPEQILFSFLKNDVCIGYGGLVHINWNDLHGEISFVMNTEHEEKYFKLYWTIIFRLLEEVAFDSLYFNKIYTYAYDLRPDLFNVLNKNGFYEEARLKNHILIDNSLTDVLIHSKYSHTGLVSLRLAKLRDAYLLYSWANDSAVRQNAISTEPIEWDEHLKWLKLKLQHPDSKIFIFLSDSIPIGQLRIDKADGVWKIDYSVAPRHRKKGYGKKIIIDLLMLFPNYSFEAFVRPENKGSCLIFEKTGFEFESMVTEKNVRLNKYCYRPHE